MTRPRLHILVGSATHFLEWELAEYGRHFELVDAPAHDVHLHVFGPDVLERGATIPAASRSAYLFPGFVVPSPYYDEAQEKRFLKALMSGYDLLFVNPGPMEALFGHLAITRVVPFSVAADRVPFRRRAALESLIHVSANYPQKDRGRSQAVMAATGLPHEMFPPLGEDVKHYWARSTRNRLRANKVFRLAHVPIKLKTPPLRYVPHATTISRYLLHDGFVHVARPVPPEVDGLYTASLIEAGMSGAIIFWHDTHNLGGFLETVFEVPCDIELAAKFITEVAADVDIARHSQQTRDEMAAIFSPRPAIARRASAINEL